MSFPAVRSPRAALGAGWVRSLGVLLMATTEALGSITPCHPLILFNLLN